MSTTTTVAVARLRYRTVRRMRPTRGPSRHQHHTLAPKVLTSIAVRVLTTTLLQIDPYRMTITDVTIDRHKMITIVNPQTRLREDAIWMIVVTKVVAGVVQSTEAIGLVGVVVLEREEATERAAMIGVLVDLTIASIGMRVLVAELRVTEGILETTGEGMIREAVAAAAAGEETETGDIEFRHTRASSSGRLSKAMISINCR